jgi:hypothetical protein
MSARHAVPSLHNGFAGPRQRPRSRFERLTVFKASGFAGGYLRVPSMFDSLEVKVLFTT